MAYSLIAEQNIEIFDMKEAFADMKNQIVTGFEDFKQEFSNYQKSIELTGNDVAKLSAKVYKLVTISRNT